MSNTLANIYNKNTHHNTYRDFKHLYGFYFNDLCKFTLKYGFNKESAEEIVSDVFLKIWKKQDKLTFNYTLRPYLHTTVKNQCIDQLRKKNKQILTSGIIPINKASSYKNPEDAYINTELGYKINIAIDTLPPECKKIFRLSRYHGLKYKEIAEKLNISIKTVEAQMSKALKRLKIQLIHLKEG